jgi:hypothetical protein
MLALTVHREIFDQEAIELLEGLCALENGAFALLSRIQGRKLAWLRVDNMVDYFNHFAALMGSIHDLQKATFLEILDTKCVNKMFEIIWSAVQSLHHQELRAFSNKISSKTSSTG